MTKARTCVAYYRVSSKAQQERGSIARQNQLIPALVKREGLRVVGEYRDDGVSGRSITKREAFSKLLADLPKLRPDYLVFLRADRFGRAEDWETLMELANAAPKFRVNLLYLKEDSLTGELTTTTIHHGNQVELYRFMGEVLAAGEENKRRGRDSRQGNFSNLMRNRWPFGPTPYGWTFDRTANKFVAVPDQIETLQFIYEKAAAGMGTPKIAQELRRRKVLLPRAAESEKMLAKLKKRWPGGEYRWDSSAIRRLLEREYHYTGFYVFDVAKQYPDLLPAFHTGQGKPAVALVDGCIEFKVLVAGKPAIKAETWKKARAHVDRRAKRHGGERRGEQEAFLFGPWLKCECGGNLKARAHRFKNPKKGLTEYRYYICRFATADTDREGRPKCQVPALRADEVDARLWSMLLDWIARPSLLLEKWLTEKPNVDIAGLEQEQEEKTAALADAQRRRAKLQELWAEGWTDKEKLRRDGQALGEEIAGLESDLETIAARLAAVGSATASHKNDGKVLADYEKQMAKVVKSLSKKLDKLNFRRRRTLLERLLGTADISLGWRPVASIRSILKRRGQDPDEFMGRYCVQPPKKGETEGLFVAGVTLPVRPAEIVEALNAAGVQPGFLLKSSALVLRCG